MENMENMILKQENRKDYSNFEIFKMKIGKKYMKALRHKDKQK